MGDQIISREGYNKLKEELDFLLNVKRKEIAERIERSKELGDLSENAEYHEAKDAQAFNDGRIGEIETALKNSTIVENNSQGDKISMGSKFITLNKTTGVEKEFTIVSFNEADPANGKISNESPIGMAFNGRGEGCEAKINTPKGEMHYKILKIIK